MTSAKAARNEIPSELRAVVDATRKQVRRQERGSIAEHKFFKSLGKIIANECPEFKSQFDELTPWFISSAVAGEAFELLNHERLRTSMIVRSDSLQSSAWLKPVLLR
jgi:hypothetical protein